MFPSHDPEGWKRVIANLRRIKQTEIAYKDALKEVVAENNGVPPLDLLEKIDDKIGTKMDKISQRFKDDLAKPVPEGQNKFITGLQAALGSVVGAPGKILSGIGHLLGGV